MSNSSNYFLTWDELHKDTRTLAKQLLGKQTAGTPWKGIISIARGGLIPAGILARELDIRIVDTLCITSYEHDKQGEISILKTIEGNGNGFLLVDDLVDTGTTARVAKQILPKATFVVVYVKPAGKPLTEMFVREFPQDTWLHFPWDSQLVGDDFSYSKPLAAQLKE
ncbi:MAG: xanthine phosphoribosyltransferase [Pseudomonadales bacterium]